MDTTSLSARRTLEPEIPLAWHAHGMTVSLRHRDPLSPSVDLAPLVAFGGAPLTLWLTLIGLQAGAHWVMDPQLRVLVALGGALGLFTGQALSYAIFVGLEILRARRERCEIDIGPARIRVRRGRRTLLELPPEQVFASARGRTLVLEGAGQRIELWASPEGTAEAVGWVAACLTELHEQALAAPRPPASVALALHRVVLEAKRAAS